MRSSFYLFLLVGMTVFISANSSSDQAFPTFLFSGDPDLPAISFDYEIELPDHLSNVWTIRDSMNSLHSITNDGATLGRVLFYDELLSANDNISCATCHKQEYSFADNTALSMGVFENTSRNTPHLNDLGWSNRFAFFWDMRVTDFKESISLPLTNSNELGNTDIEALISKMENTNYYPELFESAFGTSTITEDRIKESIVQFISSFNTFDSKIDQVQIGEASLSELEAKGQMVYEANCNSCHKSPAPGIFQIFQSADGFSLAFDVYQDGFTNGLPLAPGDIGTGVWHPEYSEKFKLVTLRNIMITAPYMHDGRFETMEEVLEHYDKGIVGDISGPNNKLVEGGLNLSNEDKTNLIAFLKTFTDESILVHEKFSDPFPMETNDEDTYMTSNDLINLFPNPTSGPVHLHWNNDNKSNIFVEIYDAKGQLFRKLSTHQTELYTNLEAFPAGMYLVKIFRGEELWQVKKVMKQ